MKNLSKRAFLKTAGLATAGLVMGDRALGGISPGRLRDKEEGGSIVPEGLDAPVTARGRIGGVEFSRLILGGNPIGGWMHAREASWVLSFGGLGLFMLGRFAGSWIMRSVRAEKMLFYCASGVVATTALVLLDWGMVSLVALLCGYAFEAIMFPTIFALSLRGLGAHTKRASSFLMMTPVGGVVGPLLMGLVADYSNMVLSFVVPFAAYIIVWFYARHILSASRTA